MPSMRRAISHKLQAWSESSHRKPLVIFGARQVGKTYAIKQLASDRYDSLAYIDFSRDAQAAALFDASLAPTELHQPRSHIDSLRRSTVMRKGADLVEIFLR